MPFAFDNLESSFRIWVSGINDPLDGFMTVSQVVSYTEAVEFNQSMDLIKRKGVGRTQYEPLVLERVYAGYDEFASWYGRIARGITDRRIVGIEYLMSDGSVRSRFDLLGAWPSRWEAPPMDSQSTDGAVERIELCFENYLLVK